MSQTRLYVTAALEVGKKIMLHKEQAHYLINVKRLHVGSEVLVFNGRHGEWLGQMTEGGRKSATLELLRQTQQQTLPPDLWLLFAPIKKARTDFIVEKATEMGCRRICPVFTEFTNTERVNVARLEAHAIEAAEQCGLNFVPDLDEPQPLHMALEALGGRRLVFCDERKGAPEAACSLRPYSQGEPWAVLIGPEGGFSRAEATHVASLPTSVRISLGPRILRADTAAVAALALWQAELGDWH